MSFVSIERLTKRFGETAVLDRVSLTIEAGEIVTLLGPSGCGKSTTLRCIAGLERPDSGTITINDHVVTSERVFEPPERRGVGLVFQSDALWPHMTCFENVALSLKVRRLRADEIVKRVESALALVGLADLGSRFPSQLSGGQQQRIAVARSVAAEPAVLLLDEPLSNLDVQVRERVRVELQDLLKKLAITTVYVTHDQAEAMAISDRVVVMTHGRIDQVGSPEEVCRRPRNRTVADFLGWANVIPVTVATDEAAGSLVAKTTDHKTINGVALHTSTGRGWIAFRPRDVLITSVPTDGDNWWRVAVTKQVYLGDYFEIHVELGGVRVRCYAPERLKSESDAYISVPPGGLLFFAEDGNEATAHPEGLGSEE